MNYQKERERILKNVFTITYNKTMNYYTLQEASEDLRWSDFTEQVHEVTILSDDRFRWRPTKVKIIVNQNGTYKLID